MIACFGNCSCCTMGCIIGDTSSSDTTSSWYYYEDATNYSITKIEQFVRNNIDLRKMKNAIKATETMIIIAKAYICRLRTIFISKKKYIIKMMFCKSGHLPKRINRIMRNK